VVEHNNPEVGDEDRVYEPSVGDKVEGNGNGDGWWGRSSCVHVMGDPKIRRSEDIFSLEYYKALYIVLRTVRNECLNSK